MGGAQLLAERSSRPAPSQLKEEHGAVNKAVSPPTNVCVRSGIIPNDIRPTEPQPQPPGTYHAVPGGAREVQAHEEEPQQVDGHGAGQLLVEAHLKEEGGRGIKKGEV